jgi:hypothetical protein
VTEHGRGTTGDRRQGRRVRDTVVAYALRDGGLDARWHERHSRYRDPQLFAGRWHDRLSAKTLLRFDFVNPFDEPANPPTPSEPKLPEPVSQDRAECEKTTRDAIDAIDFEMRETPYTKEQGEEYRAELLALTQQLRACKQL